MADFPLGLDLVLVTKQALVALPRTGGVVLGIRIALHRLDAVARDPAAAAAFLSAGESSRDARLPAPEHAAWAQVATLVLNLSEAITRN